MTTNMTKEQAIKLSETRWWEGLDTRAQVMFQLFEDRLCMPFPDFHKAVEEELGRSVWTHEFADADSLRREFLGARQPPTVEEIFAQIPKEKRIIVSI